MAGASEQSGAASGAGIAFHRLLTNETYVGVYRFGDVRVEDGVPPVIDRALFLAVDERLKNKKNPQGRHRENGEYMLTGKLFCGLCGAPMVGVSGTARSGALHHYYVCQKRRTERSCSKANVGRDWLERVVVQATLDYVLKPEVIEWMADAVMAYQEREANPPCCWACGSGSPRISGPRPTS